MEQTVSLLSPKKELTRLISRRPALRTRMPRPITAQGYSGQSWQGTVEEIADSLIPRRIRPEDPGRPTDTRVLPVRIAFQQPIPLKLGRHIAVKDVEDTEARPSPELTSTRTAVSGRR